jgi:beta-fructofuranosidase
VPAPDDPSFPLVHVRPQQGWVNDPNGPFLHRGRYHLFFQHNPLTPLHGDIHWGHASSDDLVRWRQEPLALRPTPGGPDAAGCWSGCVVDDAGRATAVYTGLSEASVGTVCLAFSDDDGLLRWSAGQGPVAEAPPTVDPTAFRDPFLVHIDGARYAVVGAGGRTPGSAMVLLFSCDDLDSWTYLGPLLDSCDPVASAHAPADVWECPQLFRLDGQWVLVVSLWTADELGRVIALVGDLDTSGSSPRLRPRASSLVDSGHDFYAPAVLVAPDRVLLWGWTWEDRSAADVSAAGWAGALTLPRELSLSPGGKLLSAPAPELEGLLDSEAAALQGLSDDLGSGPEILAASGDRFCLDLELHGDRGRASIALGPAGRPPLVLHLDLDAGVAQLAHTPQQAERRDHVTEGALPAGSAGHQVRIFVDGSVVETFVSGGPCFTERLYPSEPASWTATVTADSGFSVQWRLRALRPDVTVQHLLG